MLFAFVSSMGAGSRCIRRSRETERHSSGRCTEGSGANVTTVCTDLVVCFADCVLRWMCAALAVCCAWCVPRWLCAVLGCVLRCLCAWLCAVWSERSATTHSRVLNAAPVTATHYWNTGTGSS
jgi:hypothetical protein